MLTTLVSVVLLAVSTEASSSLRQVAVISRHGVRGPYGLGTETPSEELLKRYVRNPDLNLPLRAVEWGNMDVEDPNEIVSPKLTKHGYKVVERMGEYFRKYLYRDFIEEMPCSQAFAYADANQRDNLTAEAFLAGAYPSCKSLVPITKCTRLLFEQGQDPTATCPVCSQSVYEGITGAKDCRYLVQENREEIAELNKILDCCTPEACLLPDQPQADPTKKCTFFDIPSQWNGAFYDPWKDALSSADYFTEFMMLLALNNMTIPEPFTFEQILRLARVHEAHMDLVTNEVNSANFGATLLAHVTASFEQTASGKSVPIASGEGPSLEQSKDNRFLFYAGHDINILYLRNLLRLQWYTRGWHPHEPTPGGMLIFELHSDAPNPTAAATVQADSTMPLGTVKVGRRRLTGAEPEETFYVKAFFVTAAPEQMRNGDTLTDTNPPDVVPVMIPLCSEDVMLANGQVDVRCPLATFKSLIGRTLKHECVADSLRPFVDSLADSGSGGRSRTHPFALVLWVIFAVLVVLFVIIVVRHLVRARAQRPAVSKYGTLEQVTSD